MPIQKQTRPNYRIRLQGHLDESWNTWFDNLTITYPDEQTTMLSGEVQDQSQLHSILIKIRDLNLILLSVNPTHEE